MVRLLVFAMLAGLGGCGTSVRQVALADGRQAYEFQCGRFFDAKPSCSEAATRQCRFGYIPLASSGESLLAVCAGAPSE